MKKVFCLTAFIVLCSSLCAQNNDSLYFELNKAVHDTDKIKILKKISQKIVESNPDSAYALAAQVLQLAKQNHRIDFMASSYFLMAHSHVAKGEYNEAIKNYEIAGVHYNSAGDKKNSMRCEIYIASTQVELGNYSKAVETLETLMPEIGAMNDLRLKSRALVNLGRAYTEQGDYAKALNTLLQAAKLTEQLKDNSSLASLYTRLGVVHKKVEQYDKAIEYYTMALKYFELINNQRMICATKRSAAIVFKRQEKFGLALKYLKEVLVMASKANLKDEEATAELELGSIYNKQKKIKEAKESVNRALAIFQSIDDKKGISDCYFVLANVAFSTGEINSALAFLDKSGTLVDEMKLPEQKANILALRAEIRSGMNQSQQAFLDLKRSVNINDSIKNENITRQIVELQTKYETEKKDKELLKRNLQIEKDKAELERKSFYNYLFAGSAAALLVILFFAIGFFRQRQALEKQKVVEQTRSSIASDLHDDVGATLSSINIFSKLAKEKLGSHPQQAQLLLEKINSTSQEMMSNMSDMVWAIKPDNDAAENLSFRVKSIAQELLEQKDIRYKVDDDGTGVEKLSMKARRNIFLLVKEALNNIAKYSEAKNVGIKMFGMNGTWNLEIVDDGKGFNPERMKAGNGLSNMNTRAKELSGTFKVESQEGSGTKISAQFEIENINY